jgi:heme exporter protein B
MMRALLALYVRDIRLAARIGGGAELGVLFFLILIILFPFALGPDQKLLSRLAPAILWLAALLATLLGLDRLFQADEEDGVLDQFVLLEVPLELVVLAKVLAQWSVTALPLALLTPVLGLLLNLEPAAMLPLVATLLAGTPALTLVGAIGAALTVSLRRGGLLLSVLILPLTIPTLIFGVSATQAAVSEGVPFFTPFAVLVALTLLMLVVAPVAAAAALRSVRE